MGKLTINANDVATAVSIQARYRVLNSGGTYTILTLTPNQLPYDINGLPTAQYEVGIRKLCTNGAYSDWVTGQTAGCAAVVGFTAVLSGSNFVINATLPSPQTKIQVQVTDPNGGVNVFTHDFGGQSGTFNIPVISGLYGNYSIAGSGICDNSVTPVYASAYTSPVTVNYPNPTANNISASASYGMTFTDIRNGTANGIPTSFNSTSIAGVKSDYTASLTGGTITVALIGTIPGGFPIYLRLVKNGTTILDQKTITAAGPYTLTNPGVINAPDQISIEIDS